MERPHPDSLLSVVKQAERREGRGNLKVFLGMVAGVGKTFSMLQRAHQLKSQGVDVVIGWVDTHGRKETEGLTAGLPILARKTVSHRGVSLEELDVDAILARRPKVVIVDELAHTNAPGQRHAKRYLDVLELLNAGIDVFTAINVQHLESRIDTIAEITGVKVQETVPDSFLDQADEIVLIDLPPEDLLQRMKEGRIYPPDRAELAISNFFTRGNLAALREIALRVAGTRADRDVRDYKTLHGIGDVWRNSPRLMVAVFGSPFSESSIRWTRQLAEAMKGTWVGAYIDTGYPLGVEEKRLLEKNTQMVRELGGEFLAVQDSDFVDGLLRVARQQNVTQLIVGRSRRNFWQNLFSGGSTLDRLQKSAGAIDIYSLSSEKDKKGAALKIPSRGPSTPYPWEESGWLLLAFLLAALLASAIQPYVGYESIGIVFLMTVTVSGLFLSRVSVLTLAAALSFVHNYFFIPPLHTLTIGNPKDAMMFAMYFLAAATVGHLTHRLQAQKRRIQNREDRALTLYHLARRISECQDLEEVTRIGARELERIFQAKTCFVFFEMGNQPKPHPHSSYFPSDRELGVAVWVKENRSVAGRFTETLPASSGIYFPVQSRGSIIGVVGLFFPPEFTLDYERQNFAHAVVGQVALGLERELLHEGRKRLEMVGEAEKLYRSLFDSVSHELKTPLTTIKIASQELHAQASPSSAVALELSAQISEQAERLLDVVNHLLNMSRIESGTLKPVIQAEGVADILGPALLLASLNPGEFKVTVEEGVRDLKCDAALVVQALSNVLRNAKTYAGVKKPLEIQVSNRGLNRVEISVRDFGPGLPEARPEIIFNKFYRVNPLHSGGIGLGLSIAKGFLESQNGELHASNMADGGARVTIVLPAEHS